MRDNSIVCYKYTNFENADVNVVLEGRALCVMYLSQMTTFLP